MAAPTERLRCPDTNSTELNWLLTSHDSPVHAMNVDAFGEIFARAMSAGILRTNVSTDAMIEWVQGTMALISGREDLDTDGQRRLVRDFSLPALLRPSAQA